MNTDDTIVAVSSAVGPAARLIVRTSGTAAIGLLKSLTRQPVPDRGGSAFRCMLTFAGVTCPGWVYLFRSPASYTGEDLVEYHLPGNPVLAEFLLWHLMGSPVQDPGSLWHGHVGMPMPREPGMVRLAEPGEFTARAYFNGRMDLTQAEGVAAVVSAQSEAQVQAGRRLLEGELARRLKEPADLVLSTLVLVEVGIDFSDEDITFLPTGPLRSRLASGRASLRQLLEDSGRFKPLGYEPTFVLVGRPNAGKSTLLNALAGYQRAVASPTAGTTRDALSAEVALRRGYVRLIDVAGLEELAVDQAADDITRQMAERARTEIAQAEFAITLMPADDRLPPPAIERPADLLLLTKCDLVGDAGAPAVMASWAFPSAGAGRLRVSAVTGEGLAALRESMDELAFGRQSGEGSLSLNARHVSAISSAIEAMDRADALAEADGPAELIAAELREAIAQTGAVLGEVSPDDLLGRVFSQFCIGK